VVGVQLERRLRALTAESAAVVGADVVRDGLGVTGRGVVVAALDTGVDATHPDLQDGGVVAQKCFVLGGCPPGNTDEGDWAPEGSGHGTHVTGIVTGDGRVAPKGLAPGAGVVMVRVFDDTSYGRESDWALAMGWVADHAGALGIRVLNLSIGTDERYAGACEADWPVMAEAARRVRDAGVVLIAAAGNENEANALVAPACLPGVLSVGAVYDAALGREPDTGTYSSGCVDAATDAGTVMCLSNTSDELDLLAPGSRTRNAAPGGGVAERRGTSQATPHASAVAALMLEVDPALTPDDVERLLEETGRPTVDPKAPGRVTPLVDARAAVEATRASYCARHADGTRCALTFGACDGGACEGVCLDGRCRDSAVKTVGAVEGVWPRAPVGCASVDGAGLLALAAWRCRRRGGQRARLRA
jgi:subtilisin family serine protease